VAGRYPPPRVVATAECAEIVRAVHWPADGVDTMDEGALG
jgi:hypothetical protein